MKINDVIDITTGFIITIAALTTIVITAII